MGLCGGKDSTIPVAEEDLPRNLCPLIKSSYGFKKAKSCPYFEAADVVIGETTCDGKKKMFELLERMVKMHVMQLPYMKTEKAKELWVEEVKKLKEEIKEGMEILHNTFLTPSKENNSFLAEIEEGYITDKVSKQVIASRHTFNKDKLLKLEPQLKKFSDEAIEQILVESKYYHYIKKQEKQIQKMKEMLNVEIPENFEYNGIPGLSREIVEKLSKIRPTTLFQASEISGVTPAAIDIVHMYIKMK